MLLHSSRALIFQSIAVNTAKSTTESCCASERSCSVISGFGDVGCAVRSFPGLRGFDLRREREKWTNFGITNGVADSMEEGATTGDTESGGEGKLSSVSGLSCITVPPKCLEGFLEDYKRESANFPEDLSSTSEWNAIEEFVSAAHSIVRRRLQPKVVQQLEKFIHDPTQPSVLIIKGLPIDEYLPPSTPEGRQLKCDSRLFMSETWLVGIARIIGQPFIYESMAGNNRGLRMFVREVYPDPAHLETVSALGSHKLLDFHVDFSHLIPTAYANVLAFIGLRPDPRGIARTLLCDFRELFAKMDPSDRKILREQKITWLIFGGYLSQYVIEGSDENPQIHLLDEEVQGFSGFDTAVSGSPEAVAAYRRVKQLALEIGLKNGGVLLERGDVMLLNQRRVAHGRNPFSPSNDGTDRWIQKVFVNEGTIWKPNGLSPWPMRKIPATADVQKISVPS